MCFEILQDIVLYIGVLVSIFTYPMTCAVDVIHQMCFHIISYAFSYVMMYLLFSSDHDIVFVINYVFFMCMYISLPHYCYFDVV